MFISDPIADMLTRIKNGIARKKKLIAIPYSKLKKEILQIMVNEGFVEKFIVKTRQEPFPLLVIEPKYKNGICAINDVKRVSKPGLRIYVSYEKVPVVSSGFGLAIMSTSQGLLTDKQARHKKIGGEVLLFVW